MINLHTACLLAEYKEWADQQMFTSLAELPREEVLRERQSVFKNMVGTLNHIYAVDRIWQAHLQGQAHPYKTSHETSHAELNDLQLAQGELNRWFRDWTQDQSDESLTHPVDFTFLSGAPGVMSAGAMLLHVVNHASYHRGWICQMYFEIPARPPFTDLPVFLRDVHQEFPGR